MGDMADLYNEYMDPDDYFYPDEPSRCMFCGVQINWDFDEAAQKWRPVTLKGNRHHCRGQIPGPQQDFEVLDDA